MKEALAQAAIRAGSFQNAFYSSRKVPAAPCRLEIDPGLHTVGAQHLSGLPVPAAGTARTDKPNFEDEKGVQDNMDKTSLNVPKISCGHCVASIQNELKEMEGVTQVSGDPQSKKITVEFQAPASLAQIKAKLDEIGYPAAG